MDIFEELSLVQGKLKNKFGECEVQWELPKLKNVSVRHGTYPVSLTVNGDQFNMKLYLYRCKKST
jgi:hypothetical protein